MNILVTGATGFISSRILGRLCSRENDRIFSTSRGTPEAPIPNVTHVPGHLDDPQFVRTLLKGIDTVIHCAGLTSPWGTSDDFYKANVLTTRTLIEAAKAQGVSRFIQLSSASIYFQFKDQLDLKEDYLPRVFSNDYARTKFESEEIVRKAHGESFLTVSLRPRMVLGAGDRQVLPRLLKMHQAGMLFQVGDGQNQISVTSISNLLDAVELCLSAPASSMGQVYNIANPEPVRFWGFVNDLLRRLDLEGVTRKVPYKPLLHLARANEFLAKAFRSKTEPKLLPIPLAILAQSMTLNVDKAKAELGYTAKQSTDEALQEFVDWWKRLKTS